MICNEADYIWSKQIIERYQLTTRCHILFSPSYQQLELKSLADWIVRDRLQVRLQTQLHKYIWGNEPGR